jgi:hypothetical protein
VFLAIIGLVFGGIPIVENHSPKSRALLCVIASFMALGLISQIACGGSNSKAPATYAVQVTGTSVVTQHSTTVTISMQ